MHRSVHRPFVRLLAAAAVLVCALTAGPKPSTAQEAEAAANPLEGEIYIQPGDIVRIEIWREPDLGGEFLVDERGYVTLPLLGEKRLTGIPITSVRSELLTEYATQLRNPSIHITPLKRISVLGEVFRPGTYLVEPTVSLAGAVSLAGGTNPSGDLRKVQVVRDGSVVGNNLLATMELHRVDVRSGDQIIVGQKNWAVRNSTYVVSSVMSATFFIITLLIR